MASPAPAPESVMAQIVAYIRKMEARQTESDTANGVILNEIVDRLIDLDAAINEMKVRVDYIEAMILPGTGTRRSAENLDAAMDEIIAARESVKDDSEPEPESELDQLAARIDEVDLGYVYGKQAPPPPPPAPQRPVPPPAQPPYTPEEMALMRGPKASPTPPPSSETKAEATGKPPGFFGKLLGKGKGGNEQETAPAGPQTQPQPQAPPPPTPPPRGVRDPTRIPTPEPKKLKKTPKPAPTRMVSDAEGDKLSKQPSREMAMRRLMKLQHLKDDKGVMK